MEQDLQILRVIEKEAERSKSSYPDTNNQSKGTSNEEEQIVISMGNDNASPRDNQYPIQQSDQASNRDKGYEDGGTRPHVAVATTTTTNQEMPLGVDINVLANYRGKVCRCEVRWVDEGQMYIMAKTADWYEPIADLLIDDDEDDDDEDIKMIQGWPSYSLQTDPASRLRKWKRTQFNKSLYGFATALNSTQIGDGKIGGGGYTKKIASIPKVLKDKTEEQLVQELVKFASTKQTDYSRGLRVNVRNIFWKEKQGIDPEESRKCLPREWQAYMNKICVEAQMRLKATQRANEVKAMPELVEQYCRWFIENNCAKHTKAYVEMFLAQRGIKLSSAGISMLYAEGGQKLKKSKAR